MGYLNPHTHDLDGPDRPRIVVLCGSTRFKAQFEEANRSLTLLGEIVLAPGVFGHADGVMPSEAAKVRLDDLHLRKIDLADEVLVVSDGSGYYGDSTRREIAYAEQLGKPVRYLRTSGARPAAGAPAG
jgi:hypothetical protein